jgi:cytochrome c
MPFPKIWGKRSSVVGAAMHHVAETARVIMNETGRVKNVNCMREKIVK